MPVSIRLLRLDRIICQPDASTLRNDSPGTRSRWVTVSRGHLAHRDGLEPHDRRGPAVGFEVIALQPFAGQSPRVLLAAGLKLYAGQPAGRQHGIPQYRADLLRRGPQVDIKAQARLSGHRDLPLAFPVPFSAPLMDPISFPPLPWSSAQPPIASHWSPPRPPPGHLLARAL